MVRNFLATLVALTCLVTSARAVIFFSLDDEFDDAWLVLSVRENEAVNAFRRSLDRAEAALRCRTQPEIEKLLGRSCKKPRKTYAMPVAQARRVGISGLRATGSKDHQEFYPIQDFAGLEVYYVNDSPLAVFFFLKPDEHFSKLTGKNLAKRLDWDREQFTKLVRFVADREKAQ